MRTLGRTTDASGLQRASRGESNDRSVDCTPKRIAVKNVEVYRRRGLKFILQGGKKHTATGHSFVAESNYSDDPPRQQGRSARRFGASSRIGLINTSDGLVALNTVKELMADRGRPHDNLYEVALWADMLRVQGDELFYAYMVDNQAIVIPETIDAIRALARIVENPTESIAKTDKALGIGPQLI